VKSKMKEAIDTGKGYYCLMHRDVRQPTYGKCSKCGMALLPEGTRFAMLQHMVKNPMMIIAMAAIMIAAMAVMI